MMNESREIEAVTLSHWEREPTVVDADTETDQQSASDIARKLLGYSDGWHEKALSMVELVEEIMLDGYQGGSSDPRYLVAYASLAIEIADGLKYKDLSEKERREAFVKHLIED